MCALVTPEELLHYHRHHYSSADGATRAFVLEHEFLFRGNEINLSELVVDPETLEHAPLTESDQTREYLKFREEHLKRFRAEVLQRRLELRGEAPAKRPLDY